MSEPYNPTSKESTKKENKAPPKKELPPLKPFQNPSNKNLLLEMMYLKGKKHSKQPGPLPEVRYEDDPLFKNKKPISRASGLNNNFANKYAALDEMEKFVMKQNKKDPIKPKKSKKPSTASSRGSLDQNLISSLVNKVSELEKTLAGYRTNFKQKIREVGELKNKLKKYEDLIDASEESTLQKMEELESKLNYYKIENDEIKSYLLTYGVKWKENSNGGEPEGQIDQIALKKDIEDAKLPYRYNVPKEIDINVLDIRISELNKGMMKEGLSKVEKGKDGIHRFSEIKPLNIILFKNGILMDTFPFFKYGTKDAVILLTDILEGYFPKQLEKSFPDGILLKLVDKLDELYERKNNNIVKPGDRQPMSKDEFLSKLPKQVLKDGKLISVREEIRKKFEKKNDQNQISNYGNKVLEDQKGRLLILNDLTIECKEMENSELVEMKIALIKIRREKTGEEIYIFLEKTSCIKELYVQLKKLIGSDFIEDIELMTNYPKKILEIDDSSIEQIGLFPQGRVFLKEVPMKLSDLKSN